MQIEPMDQEYKLQNIVPKVSNQVLHTTGIKESKKLQAFDALYCALDVDKFNRFSDPEINKKV